MAPVRLAPLRSAPLKFAPVRSARAPPSFPEKNLSCASKISDRRLPLCLIDLGFLSPIVHSPALDSMFYFTGIEAGTKRITSGGDCATVHLLWAIGSYRWY